VAAVQLTVIVVPDNELTTFVGGLIADAMFADKINVANIINDTLLFSIFIEIPPFLCHKDHFYFY
jgi:hypothetical protein